MKTWKKLALAAVAVVLMAATPKIAGNALTVDILTILDTKSNGKCTLNGGTPSTCTATVNPATFCKCSPVGTTAVIAAAGCAVSLSSTTLTITSGATLTNDVNYNCF